VWGGLSISSRRPKTCQGTLLPLSVLPCKEGFRPLAKRDQLSRLGSGRFRERGNISLRTSLGRTVRLEVRGRQKSGIVLKESVLPPTREEGVQERGNKKHGHKD